MAGEPALTMFELLSIIGAVGAGTASLSAFIFLGANSLRKEFWRGNQKVLAWQAKHDRKDDKRFAIMDQALWEISYRNSLKDGQRPKAHKPINDIVDQEMADEEDD